MLFFIKILGAALVSTFALAEPELAAPEPDDEATEDVIERDSRLCTMSGDSGTGRVWGRVRETNNPDVCIRERLGGEAPIHYPSCHEVGRNEFGCRTFVSA
ncbi:hypothetical protein OV203_41955 [Nannocystis sp. ILAH1]|uniref:hypothetical protein n=1 Tax=unclassified Nannocystis TaxID=2627009 RepID=UPI00226DA9ED|nr:MULTISPECIES: hypothetical protein [unclassified Nannocystis]MCY0993777.1 hypothetical protein [Nannocystis sp. ILAH1]MCY1065859.1 hypothetical protein [Nannocystis sp. RBIL2]